MRKFSVFCSLALVASAASQSVCARQAAAVAGQKTTAAQASQASSTGRPATSTSQPATTGGDPAAASAAPPFEQTDIHTSAKTQFPFIQGPNLRGERYTIKQATMVDLISAAYGLESEKVLGGPTWLDTDRFDINAKAPAGASADTQKLMLQALLAERFKLVIHNDQKSMQAYELTVGKGGKTKMQESAGSGEPDCAPVQQDPPQQGQVPQVEVTCKNMPMDTFATTLHQMAGGYLAHTVTNSTALKGSYDFNLKWTPRGALAQAGSEGISIFDAVDKQLALHLELRNSPQPVIVVDSVNEKPSPNAPGVGEPVAPAGPLEFEVAVVKPSRPDEQLFANIDRGGNVNVQGFTLKLMIAIAWNINPQDNQAMVNAPKWLDSDKYDITAKTNTTGEATQLDFDQLRGMLQALLQDRFKLKVHMEDQPINAYTLLAPNPKIKKADPMGRTGCKEGPGADGKDPRITTPILGRLLTCTNITMGEFVEKLPQLVGGYIYQPVENATNLDGRYDFTISFSTFGQYNGGGARGFGGDGGAASATGTSTAATDPSGAVSLYDAVNKQLGLKLEMRKRPLPVLVIDHIEQKPTDN